MEGEGYLWSSLYAQENQPVLLSRLRCPFSLELPSSILSLFELPYSIQWHFLGDSD